MITFYAPNNARVTCNPGPVARALMALHPARTVMQVGPDFWVKSGREWLETPHGTTHIAGIERAARARCEAIAGGVLLKNEAAER